MKFVIVTIYMGSYMYIFVFIHYILSAAYIVATYSLRRKLSPGYSHQVINCSKLGVVAMLCFNR